MKSTDYTNRQNMEFLEGLYETFKQDPASVDPLWQKFFEGVEFVSGSQLTSTDTSHTAEVQAFRLIQAYRDYGHLGATLDPLDLENPEFPDLLKPKSYGLDDKLDEAFSVQSLLGLENQNLGTIVEHLKKVYCGNITVQLGGCEPEVKSWFQKRLETESAIISHEEKKRTLDALTKTEALEKFLHTRYVGMKRFSIEGCDALIPMLEKAIQMSPKLGISEYVLGMAHRGRVNVLANFMGKNLKMIFTEFDGKMGVTPDYDGDVKYHLGHSADRDIQGHNCHISLAFNPSHLEAVNPVVCGMVRAKQRRIKDTQERKKVIPILIHGDAAIIGQGVVSENFQLSQLDGYKVGGSIHIILNNQVGFTTNPSDSRSTRYASDIAKTIKAPILLVNADDAEAANRAMELAVEYRQTFGQDVLIDLIGYRRFGHNEGDEPAFTQPLMYQKIKKHPTTRTQYAAKLIENQVITEDDSKTSFRAETDRLQEILDDSRNNPEKPKPSAFKGYWQGLKKGEAEDFNKPTVTKTSFANLEKTMKALITVPDDFKLHSKVQKLLDARQKQFNEDKLDWGLTELLCYGSLLLENTPVRLSGQDCIRGTFTHRHSKYFDSQTGEAFSPLSTLNPEESEFCVYNSNLSEMAVLGFEYGNSISDPKFLTIWEAQFGDFANGAQIVIDQFITSGESKWFRMNGLTLLLPHGYEGQGPEHSSARLERFLQMCAQENIQVCNLTTPAQLFHVLRRQMKRDFRKPLVIMSPKSLLRHPEVTSTKKDLTEGHFQEVITDPNLKDGKNIKRLVYCSGKLYYDLLAKQKEVIEKNGKTEVALIRLEQIYPTPSQHLIKSLELYPDANEIVWAQEEPQNMGAYWHIAPKLRGLLKATQRKADVYYVGRTERSSPATGSPRVHKEEQLKIIETCFKL